MNFKAKASGQAYIHLGIGVETDREGLVYFHRLVITSTTHKGMK